ncbi:MAG TPA: PHP domain-containing protein [Ignavibacteriaceae bacterium]|nr:PHP domain-containing protein [Ignavibacteriaceae bacterium]
MIPLHVHSYYTLLKGTARIEELIEAARKNHLSSLALTDTNGMYGLIPFAKSASENGIKPILGCVIDQPNDESVYAILLARNNSGYEDICKIITSRKLNDNFDLESLISQPLENLYIITPSIKLLKKAGQRHNVFAELILTERNKKDARILFAYLTENKIRYAATNPVYFLNAGDYELHKAVSAIRLNKNLDNLSDEDIVDSEFYFKDNRDLEKMFAKVSDAFKNSEYIASDCNVDLHLKEYKFPIFATPDGKDSYSLLWEKCFEGLNRRYSPVTDAAVNRLNMEIQVIKEMNFVDYFLVVWDIVKEAKKRGMVTIGRGSAANSIVSYCLGLTDVDPIKYDLYFERFLNKGRSSPPDVDIDFSWKERDEIVKYVFDKYGYENVAMISTTVTFKARSAFREIAKAYGLTNEEISKYSKFIPWTDARNLTNLSVMFPEAKALNFKIEPWKSIINLASRLAGFPRHLSIHPGGIIITPKPITTYTALEYAKNKGLGLIITQPDMYSIEDLGLVKIDLLSQRSLGVLRDTLDTIQRNS